MRNFGIRSAMLAASACSALFLAAPEAKALSFTLDFDGFTNGNASELNFSENGLEARVTAGTRGGDSRSLRVFGDDDSIGVNGNDIREVNGRTNSLNSELVRFAFNQRVRLTEIVFTEVDDTDSFTLSSDTNFILNQQIRPALRTTFSNLNFDDVFEIQARQQTDSFRIFSVSGETAQVPTPALLPGLVGMGVAARRKRKQAAAE